MSENSPRTNESILSWVLIGFAAFAGLFSLLWLVAANYIVFYLTPLVDAAAFPWRLLPTSVSGTTLNDLAITYQLYRQHPGLIGLGDWFAYLNQAFKPWVYLFMPLYVAIFLRQLKKTSVLRSKKITPNSFVQSMAQAFPEIAPVICIQKEIVANKHKEWRRQTFPDELLRSAQTPNKRPILVVDPEYVPNRSVFNRKSDEERSLKIDKNRLAHHLRHTVVVKSNGIERTHNHYLGFQITHLSKDLAKAKANTAPRDLPTDRLSEAGKAIFAILAPYAYGSAAGKAQSKRVSDVLNRSAYGNEKGFANLSQPIISESFDQWRSHEHILNLTKIHHWEHTFLMALLAKARRSGKVRTASFIWLRPMARILFWALDDAGRKTPSAESALAFSQYQFELECITRGLLPLHRNENNQLIHTIYVDQVVRAFDQEWEHWREGIDDTDDWLHDKNLWTSLADNPVWQTAWQDIEQSQTIPEQAL